MFKYEFCINIRLYEFDDFFIATNVSVEYEGERGWKKKHVIKILINLLIIGPNNNAVYGEISVPSLASIILFYVGKFQQNSFVGFTQNKTHFTVNLQVKLFWQF